MITLAAVEKIKRELHAKIKELDGGRSLFVKRSIQIQYRGIMLTVSVLDAYAEIRLRVSAIVKEYGRARSENKLEALFGEDWFAQDPVGVPDCEQEVLAAAKLARQTCKDLCRECWDTRWEIVSRTSFFARVFL